MILAVRNYRGALETVLPYNDDLTDRSSEGYRNLEYDARRGVIRNYTLARRGVISNYMFT